jgi:hypothetical protein
MKRFKRFILIITLLNSFVCSATEVKKTVGEEFKVEDKRIKVLSIVDSLCKAVCVWAGDIRVSVNIDDSKYTFSHSPGRLSKPLIVGTKSVSVKKVNLDNDTITFEIKPAIK